MISIDGDTSTNDNVVILANGMAGNAEITGDGADYTEFSAALHAVMYELSRKIAADGEGATKLIECEVSSAPNWETARDLAKSVVASSLTKAAIFGADANWGRVLCAMGYSGAEFDPLRVDVKFASAAGELLVCADGYGVEFSEELAKQILLQPEIKIYISIKSGDASATAFGCDLTYDYVKINGDYRS
jgi:glutamate N-acetyltransferase/amino-acid N-acetyltransferase